MIVINKDGNEPQCLKKLVTDGHTDFGALQGNCKKEVQNALSEEQGKLCAYCRRTFISKVFIEHIDLQNSPTGIIRKLDYDNLHGCCSGKIYLSKPDKEAVLFCSVERGNTAMTLNLKDPCHIATISYDDNLKICSSDQQINIDINSTLNLNNDKLLQERLNQLSIEESAIVNFALEMTIPKIDAYNKGIVSIQNRDDVPYKEAIIYILKRKIEYLQEANP